jgi:apolipoprotein N-acyltransferase
VLTGSPSYTRNGEGYSLFKPVYLVTPDGAEFPPSIKTHLFPFGNTCPLRAICRSVQVGPRAGDSGPTDAAPLAPWGPAPAFLICYEAIFRLPRNGWRPGPIQLATSATTPGSRSRPPRSISVGRLAGPWSRPIFTHPGPRTGISAVIDPKGRILAQSGLFTTQRLGYSETALLTGQTPFHRFRGLIHWTCGVVAALLGAVAILSAPRRRHDRLH